MRALKEDLLRVQRQMIKQKLQRAESKRQLQLKMKIRKAHEEETKVCVHTLSIPVERRG